MRNDEGNKINNKEKPNLKKLFNMNYILSQLMNFVAYIIAVVSAIVLVYISFIEHLDISFDWTTMTIYSLLAISISWINWNAFYRQRYEKIMTEDIAQNEVGKYSVHARYYYAVKDWDDKELQAKIDEFNREYTAKWLQWVEYKTGRPIKTKTEVELDDYGKPVIDKVTGEPKVVTNYGLKDLPYIASSKKNSPFYRKKLGYKLYKYPILMYRIKTHKYPESGYKSSMELMSLLSFQDANLNKRNLRADKQYYHRKSITRFITSLGLISIGGSMIPDMIDGNIAGAILKLIVALMALLGAIVSGSISGVKGARLKLSIVEDTCADLERWANKKPKIAKYKEIKLIDAVKLDKPIEPPKEETPSEVVEHLFNQQNSQKE